MEKTPHDQRIILFGIVFKTIGTTLKETDWMDIANRTWEWAGEKVQELYQAASGSDEAGTAASEEDTSQYISEKQAKRFWAIAKNDGGFTEERLRRFLTERKINSVKKIPWKMYTKLCEAVANVENAKKYNGLK